MSEKQETEVTITVPKWFEVTLQYSLMALLGVALAALIGLDGRGKLVFAVGAVGGLAGLRLVQFAWRNAMQGLAKVLAKFGFKGKKKE